MRRGWAVLRTASQGLSAPAPPPSHQRCPPWLRFMDGSCSCPPLQCARWWELAPRQPAPVLSYLQHLGSDKNTGSTPSRAGINITISSGSLSSPLS